MEYSGGVPLCQLMKFSVHFAHRLQRGGGKEKLFTERHGYNLEVVDGKIMQKEFVVASPQQQQVIANFTASSTKRRLVLEPLLVSL